MVSESKNQWNTLVGAAPKKSRPTQLNFKKAQHLWDTSSKMMHNEALTHNG